MQSIEHKHFLGRFEVLAPPLAGCGSYLDRWMRRLVDGLQMKLLSGPYLRYVDVPGNRGWTGVCIIETSHIAIHIWDEKTPSLVQLDVYTCGAMVPSVVYGMVAEFNIEKGEFWVLDREHGLQALDLSSGGLS